MTAKRLFMLCMLPVLIGVYLLISYVFPSSDKYIPKVPAENSYTDNHSLKKVCISDRLYGITGYIAYSKPLVPLLDDDGSIKVCEGTDSELLEKERYYKVEGICIDNWFYAKVIKSKSGQIIPLFKRCNIDEQ